MKRLLWILCLMLTLCLVFAACGKTEEPNDDPDEGTEQPGENPEGPGEAPGNGENPDGELKPTEGLAYTLIDNGAAWAVSGIGTATTTDIVIPATYEGKPVTVIGKGAFASSGTSGDRGKVTSVVIPSSIVTIEEEAFLVCPLISVNIPEGVKHIGVGAFAGSETLREVQIPASVETIGEEAFAENALLQNVTIAPNSQLKSIGENAFVETMITSFTIPDGVTSIGEGAFEYCLKLVQLTNLSSVTVSDLPTDNIGFEMRTSLSASFVNTLEVDEDGDILFTVDNTVYWMGTVNDRASIDLTDKKVDKVYVAAMYGNDTCYSVILPSGVKEIAVGAFYDCKCLMSLSLPETLTHIGASAVYSDSLLTLTVPASVISLGNRAIDGNKLVQLTDLSGLVDVEPLLRNEGFEVRTSTDTPFVNTLTVRSDGYALYTVGETVYVMGYYGEKTNELDFTGLGVTAIYENAFCGLQNIDRVVIPEGVTVIGSGAFWDCQVGDFYWASTILDFDDFNSGSGTTWYKCRIANLYISDVAAWCSLFASIDFHPDHDRGPLHEAKNVYFGDAEMNCVVIPEGTTSIAAGTFAGITVESLVLPASIQKIEGGAFSSCKRIYVPNLEIWCGMEYTADGKGSVRPYGIDWLLYADNVLVQDLTIPASVTELKDAAFYGCASIKSVTIPASVTRIAWHDKYGPQGSFGYNYALTEMTFLGGAEEATGHFEYVPKLVRITDTVGIFTGTHNDIEVRTSLDTPFASVLSTDNDGVETYTINGKVYLLNYHGTNPVLDLTGKGITDVRNYALYGSSVASVILPEGVLGIGDYAFSFCGGLVSITIPASVTSIGYEAFYTCPRLTAVNLSANSQLKSIGEYAFFSCSSLTSIMIPASVTSIGSYAFARCTALTTVSFGENSQLKKIDRGVFGDCSALKTIKIPTSVTSVEATAFSRCENLIQKENGVHYVDNWVIDCDGSVTSVVLRANTVGIGSSAFYYCDSLTEITIPASVTSIGSSAFEDCRSLTTITIPASVTSIGSSAFEDCSSLTTVSFGENSQLQSIDYDAFSSCTSLATITIPASVTSIGYSAFERCTALTTVSFGENSQLASIGDAAFLSCVRLTTITIPASVTSIGESAFEYCNDLTDVYFGGSAAQWNTITIGGANDDLKYATIHFAQ